MITHLLHYEGALFVCLGALGKWPYVIHNSIDFLGLVFTFPYKQIMFMDVFVQNTYMLFCTCSAFPSSQIPNKTLCSLSNCFFSFPFFSCHSSSLNDLNVLGIFSQDFLQQYVCCKRYSILISYVLLRDNHQLLFSYCRLYLWWVFLHQADSDTLEVCWCLELDEGWDPLTHFHNIREIFLQ